MTRPDPRGLLELAVTVARRAGAMVMTRQIPGAGEAGIGVLSTKSSPTDVVTAMDHASEALIRKALLGARPDDGFLGEESEGSEGISGVQWVVDPIDGTVNYLYGIPAYAVSIAARWQGEVVAGVVHNPASGETWTASLGRDAHLDGAPIQVSEVSELRLALVATGFGYDAGQRAIQAELAGRLLPRVRDIRRMGAASLDLCAVATGRVDAYYEQGLKPWDLAAAGLVATQAGARVEGAYGRPAGEALVIAAPPGLFGLLHDEVAGLAGSATSG